MQSPKLQQCQPTYLVTLEALLRRQHHAALVAPEALLARVGEQVAAQVVLVHAPAADVAHHSRFLATILLLGLLLVEALALP